MDIKTFMKYKLDNFSRKMEFFEGVEVLIEVLDPFRWIPLTFKVHQPQSKSRSK